MCEACVKGASSLSETAVSCCASARRAWVCRVWLRSRAVVGAGSMRSLLSGLLEGDWDGVPESRREKIKICLLLDKKNSA